MELQEIPHQGEEGAGADLECQHFEAKVEEVAFGKVSKLSHLTGTKRR